MCLYIRRPQDEQCLFYLEPNINKIGFPMSMSLNIPSRAPDQFTYNVPGGIPTEDRGRDTGGPPRFTTAIYPTKKISTSP